MISRVSVWNFGPFTKNDFTFDPANPNILAGRSEAGKTSIMEAVSYCLFGKWSNGDAFPASYIHTGAKALAIEVELANGMVLRRTLTASGTKKRIVVRGGETFEYDNESDFYNAIPTPVLESDNEKARAAKEGLAKAWKNQELIRFFMFPQVLRWPMWFSGNAREVRDILLSAAPGCSITSVAVEEMKKAGYEQDPKGILPEEDQAKVVTACNSAVKKAEGSKETAETSKSDAEKALKDAEGTFNQEAFDKARADAKKVVDDERQWSEYNTLMAAWTRANESIELAKKTLADWRARKAGIGAEPSKDSKAALDKARADLVFAKAAQITTANEWKRINALLERNKEELVRTSSAALPADNACPTCGNTEWSGAEQWKTDQAAHASDCKEAIAKNEVALAIAKKTYEDAKAKTDTLAASIETLAAEAQTRITWEASLAALGTEPPAPGKKTDEPAKPNVERPVPDQLSAALATLSNTAPNLDALRNNIATASRRLVDASKVLDEAQTKAKRAKALLEAVRVAPSIVASRVSEFENIGDAVKVVFEKDTTTILVKDKTGWMPYDKGPSTGRRIRADAILRMWLKSKSRLPLPVFIDSTESCKVKDEPIPVKGFCISLVNEDCDIKVKGNTP